MAKEELTIGGQAVIEGVLMKSKSKIAIAVRKPNDEISVKVEKLNIKNKFIKKSPLIRGIFILLETVILGIKALSYSANESLEEEEEKISNFGLFLTILSAVGISVFAFVFLPLILTKAIYSGHGWIFNLIDGLIRVGIFVCYILVIPLMKDIYRVFQYHGAEHKTVNCYEAGKDLTVDNVRTFSTIHPRCGTTFIIIVLILSIAVFSFVHTTSFLEKFLIRVVLLPAIAGISFELLKLGGKYFNNPMVKVLLFPGLVVQKLTTREPTGKQIEVAIKALKGAL